MSRILLTYPRSDLHAWYGPQAQQALRELGELVLREDDGVIHEDDLIELADGCDLIISDKPTGASERLFKAQPQLQAFLRCAMDLRGIDVEAASRHGVLVTHAGPGFINAVSEWIVAQMINLARGLPQYYAAYQNGLVPAQRMGRQVAGSTAGIIGFGQIAATLTLVLQAMGQKVVTYDPYLGREPAGVERLSLDELLTRSDYVICLASHNAETENLAGATFFSRMKKGAFFINASRGRLVDEQALNDALGAGHLAGAAIDVGRGHDDHPTTLLARRDDLLATPHIGGMVPEAISYQVQQTIDQARTILAGRIPDGAVNPSPPLRMQGRPRAS